MKVDAIEQWAGKPGAIPLDVVLRANAHARGIASEAARARVHRRDEHEASGVRDRCLRARDDDATVLERLTQGFERVTRKLEQLVEKQHALMRETDLARPRRRAAADESR